MKTLRLIKPCNTNMVSLLTVCFIVVSCTKLEEKYPANLTSQQISNSENEADILYNDLVISLKQPFQNPFGDVIGLSELTTDEVIGPTRGNNWDDNGIWRALHQHKWNPDHSLITGCFNDLSGVVFAATDFLRVSSTPEQKAAARFYRAWAMYWQLDMFDQVPYRDPGESTLLPARVMRGDSALNYIISEVSSVMGELPDAPVTTPTKNAARVFLMKCYLNRAVYLNRQAPRFDLNDMNKVISLADEVINAGQYTFSNNYFDNFAPDNTNIGKENIFTEENIGGQFPNSLLMLYSLIPLHYGSTPFGYNGWTTLSEFYGKFESGDLRRGQAYNTGPPNPGNRINMGFLAGQQYSLWSDEPLADAPDRPLIFTPEVKAIETDVNLNVTGIRPQKYAIDFAHLYGSFSSPVDNDWVYLRLPDVLLMKAEAILWGGTATNGSTAVGLVNSIRTHSSRGASALSSVDLDILLDERGRELWLECWRRQDLIRFGKFLAPFQEKNYTSEPKYLLFPIPNQQIAVNRNLRQNPGY